MGAVWPYNDRSSMQFGVSIEARPVGFADLFGVLARILFRHGSSFDGISYWLSIYIRIEIDQHYFLSTSVVRTADSLPLRRIRSSIASPTFFVSRKS